MLPPAWLCLNVTTTFLEHPWSDIPPTSWLRRFLLAQGGKAKLRAQQPRPAAFPPDLQEPLPHITPPKPYPKHWGDDRDQALTCATTSVPLLSLQATVTWEKKAVNLVKNQLFPRYPALRYQQLLEGLIRLGKLRHKAANDLPSPLLTPPDILLGNGTFSPLQLLLDDALKSKTNLALGKHGFVRVYPVRHQRLPRLRGLSFKVVPHPCICRGDPALGTPWFGLYNTLGLGCRERMENTLKVLLGCTSHRRWRMEGLVVPQTITSALPCSIPTAERE